MITTTNGKNWLQVTDQPVELEKQAVEVQECREMTGHCRGTYGTHLKLNEEKPESSRRVSCWWGLEIYEDF